MTAPQAPAVAPADRPEMEEVKPGKWVCPVHDYWRIAVMPPDCPHCEREEADRE